MSHSVDISNVFTFKPFSHIFICPECRRSLPIYVQPLHLSEQIACPDCGRPISFLIRNEIKKHIAEIVKV